MVLLGEGIVGLVLLGLDGGAGLLGLGPGAAAAAPSCLGRTCLPIGDSCDLALGRVGVVDWLQGS